MPEFQPLLVLVPVVACPLASRVLSGDRAFADVYVEPAPLQPPAWVFGPVWTILYALLGYALALAAEAGPDTDPHALRDVVVLLTVNVLWTPLFLRRYTRASLALLFFMVAQAAWVAGRNEPLRPYLAPYILWLGFATFLNADHAARPSQGTPDA